MFFIIITNKNTGSNPRGIQIGSSEEDVWQTYPNAKWVESEFVVSLLENNRNPPPTQDCCLVLQQALNFVSPNSLVRGKAPNTPSILKNVYIDKQVYTI
ncbi:hypothetical protein [Desulfosporosinus shakirovi]|uniref:hypothetical protein n=1 Tax=Desulfosporosinus shakirovi TaxID=2885154 RepID=UPI001E3B7244|nr:hypothetical protein [Desulfosporosinus sp. SRJS8]MCB8815441.1 hypothetical protein [Desulfosporosinus sp. SRJS8]